MNKARKDVQLGIFVHHIYELKRGLRGLVLYKADKFLKRKIENRLKREKMAFIVYSLGESHINVFFGNVLCVEVVKRINKEHLNDYTAEEDFMLGIMLGYGLIPQIERFLNYKKKHKE